MAEVIEIADEVFPPACLPIKCLEELLSWKKWNISWSVHAEPMAARTDYLYKGSDTEVQISKTSCPRTLLCHDMKGGYLEDRFVLGTSDVLDPYMFTHWAHVDTFVYFSHHFVTIPPVGWINAAHLHGVQILGTVITEWNDGEKIWQQLFEDEEKMNVMIRNLVDICKHCKFDGYLINIENKVPPEHLDKIANFVDVLTKLIHRKVKDSLIIWYDSIIAPSGELKWQNELNENNKDFFQKCDGIFLNYNWTEDTLKASLKNAGVRKHDVYVGVDVFGRGCYGGGGFNCDLAMEKIREYNFSAAIFGHGWTHETKTETENFNERESLFWSKLKPYLYTHVLVLNALYTCFNNGYGTCVFLNGRKDKDAVQYNLGKQSLQTYMPSTFLYNEGFNGTGCIKLEPSEDETYHVLFLNQINLQTFKVRLATKCNSNYDYSLILFYVSLHARKHLHKYVLRKDEKVNETCDDFSSTLIYDSQSSSDSNRNKMLVWFKCAWDVKTFTVEAPNHGYISQIGIQFTTESNAELLLGELNVYI